MVQYRFQDPCCWFAFGGSRVLQFQSHTAAARGSSPSSTSSCYHGIQRAVGRVSHFADEPTKPRGHQMNLFSAIAVQSLKAATRRRVPKTNEPSQAWAGPPSGRTGVLSGAAEAGQGLTPSRASRSLSRFGKPRYDIPLQDDNPNDVRVPPLFPESQESNDLSLSYPATRGSLRPVAHSPPL